MGCTVGVDVGVEVAVGVGDCWRAGVLVGVAAMVAVGVGIAVGLVTGSSVGGGVRMAVCRTGASVAAAGGAACSPPQATRAIRAARHNNASIAAGPAFAIQSGLDPITLSSVLENCAIFFAIFNVTTQPTKKQPENR